MNLTRIFLATYSLSIPFAGNSITNFHQLSDVRNCSPWEIPPSMMRIVRIYSIDANGVLLPPDTITWDDLKDLRNSEYSLANPSGEPLLLKWLKLVQEVVCEVKT